MKSTIKFCLLFIIAGLFFTACNKENIDDTIPTEDPTYEPGEISINNLINGMTEGSNDAIALNCLRIDYPFEMVLEDDTKVEITTYNEYKMALEAKAPKRVTDFSFPLSGRDQNNEATSFNDVRSLGNSFASCVPDQGWIASTRSNTTIPAFLLDGFCFELVYPVNLEDEDGNGYIANNEEEFIDLCVTVDPLFFTLPLSVIDFEGTTLTFEDVSSFFDALVECEGISPPAAGDGIEIIGFGCLTLQYPFDLAVDGEIVTVDDEDEYVTILMSGANLEIQYPFNLTNSEGETLVINSFEDIITALEDCGVIIDIEPVDCVADIEAAIILFYNYDGRYPYDVDFPITMIREEDGQQFVINDYNEYFETFGGPFGSITKSDIVYPITLTQFGQEIVISSDADMCEFYETLFFVCDSKPAHIQFFYSFANVPSGCSIYPDFPIEITLNSSTIELTSLDQYYDLLAADEDAYEGIELVYPVSAFETLGDIITFESDNDLCEFLNNCN